MVLPSTATDSPNREAPASDAVSVACRVHVVPLRVKTNVGPGEVPAATVSPSTARSVTAVCASGSASTASWAQAVPARRNTTTERWTTTPFSRRLRAATAVSPSRSVAGPKLSSLSPAVSRASTDAGTSA